MRRGNDGGLFCHILETGAIGSHLFDKYRQSSTFFQRQNRPFPPIPTRCSVPFCFTSFSFLSGGEKRTRAKAALVRQRRVVFPQIFLRAFLLFSSVLFLSVKEKEPKRKLRNLLRQCRCARPSAELGFPAKNILRGFSFEKPRRIKTENG